MCFVWHMESVERYQVVRWYAVCHSGAIDELLNGGVLTSLRTRTHLVFGVSYQVPDISAPLPPFLVPRRGEGEKNQQNNAGSEGTPGTQ